MFTKLSIIFGLFSLPTGGTMSTLVEEFQFDANGNAVQIMLWCPAGRTKALFSDVEKLRIWTGWEKTRHYYPCRHMELHVHPSVLSPLFLLFCVGFPYWQRNLPRLPEILSKKSRAGHHYTPLSSKRDFEPREATWKGIRGGHQTKHIPAIFLPLQPVAFSREGQL